MIQLLFSISLFISASLLFVIQPMVAKSLLPVYGGTPAVWNICMLFFQVLLLTAYGYAWFLSRFKNQSIWRLIHLFLVLLALTCLPLSFKATEANTAPDLLILFDLLGQLGLPLLVVAASAPLLQFAYSHTSGKQADDPYFLYAASNVGSLLALLSYPWLIERFTGLEQQFHYWNYLYTAYLVLLVIIFMIPARPVEKTVHIKQPISWRLILLWTAYSFVPCSLMLGVTFYISTDIASTPLFWVLPLALYLLSFVMTFARKPWVSKDWLLRNSLIFIIFPVLGFIFGANLIPVWQLITMHLFCFMMLALLCHSELVSMRPPADKLTAFYCCMAFGGVLAGIYNGLLAPRIFNGAYEYPLVFVLATLCIPMVKKRPGWLPLGVFLVLIINYSLSAFPWYSFMKTNHVAEMAALLLIVLSAKSRENLFLGMAVLFVFIFSPWFKQIPVFDQQRNFYGVKQITMVAGAYALMSQNTLHGFQLPGVLDPASGARAYYGPVKAIMKGLQETHPAVRATILGLGTGMLACQFRPVDQLEMIDIDEQVIAMARDTRFFTYLRDCPTETTINKGDGRLVMVKKADASNEVIIVDAFSSDAIPTHLLTYEAFVLYQKKLTDDGVLLVNISNRYIHLLPVLVAAGRELDLMVLQKSHGGDNKAGQFPSEWVMLTANQPLALSLMKKEGWRFVTEDAQLLWTDNYSNLVPLIKW